MPSCSHWRGTRRRIVSPASVKLVQVSSFFVIVYSNATNTTLFLHSDAPTATTGNNHTPATVTQAGNAPVTLTESRTILTSTSTPSTPPSAICPAANGSIYSATNKPHLTINSGLSSQINQTTLSFEVLCYTNFVEGTVEGSKNSVMDLQLISNVSSLADCMDACALYNFQMREHNFPAYACTGLAWGVEAYLQQLGFGWPVCRLKNNVTLSSTNDSASYPGCDGAVLLNV